MEEADAAIDVGATEEEIDDGKDCDMGKNQMPQGRLWFSPDIEILLCKTLKHH